jgi:hypothetical protein
MNIFSKIRQVIKLSRSKKMGVIAVDLFDIFVASMSVRLSKSHSKKASVSSFFAVLFCVIWLGGLLVLIGMAISGASVFFLVEQSERKKMKDKNDHDE